MKPHHPSLHSAFPLFLSLATFCTGCGDPRSNPSDPIGSGGNGGGSNSSSSSSSSGSGGSDVGGGGGAGGGSNVTSELSDPLFAATSIPRIDITISASAMAALAQTPYEYVSGDVQVNLGGDKISLPNVGVRLKGKVGSYRQLDGKSAFLIKFDKYDKNQTLLGLEKLALNNMVQDASMIREYISYTLFRDMNVPSSRAAWAEVYVNNQLYGLYTTVEPTDNDVFLQKWFGSDQGNLYEGEYGSDLIPGLDSTFDLDSGNNVGFQDLFQLTSAIEAMTDPQTFLTDVGAVIDIDSYLRFAATELYLGHWDGYVYWRNNYFIYRRPSDQRWVFVPWGVDQTLSDHMDIWASYGRIQEKCVASQPCRNALAKTYEQVVSHAQALELDKRAAGLESFIWDAMVADPRKEVDSGTVSWAIADTVKFLQDRPAEVLAQLVCADPSAVDNDNDGASGCGFDCDDDNPQVSPNAAEQCNFADDNCNGQIDDDPMCPQCVMQPNPGGGTLALCFGVRSWNDAEADCVAQGGHLASIHDQAEQDYISQAAFGVMGGDWWVGLSDQAQEGQYVWTDGTSTNYTNWMGGEPNNWEDSEDCMHIVDWAGGGWNDLNCGTPARYVCKLP